MKRTCHGSCHCGAVHFTAPIDLDEGIRKCNCTYCFKTGYRKAFAYGDAVEITKGEDMVGHYAADPSSWPPGHIDHASARAAARNSFPAAISNSNPSTAGSTPSTSRPSTM